MKKHLPTTLQAFGSSIIAVSLAIVSIPLGLAFAGVAFIVFGIAAERDNNAQ
jgi:mannitol/fructose-specific phosphotransferase system IIA component